MLEWWQWYWRWCLRQSVGLLFVAGVFVIWLASWQLGQWIWPQPDYEWDGEKLIQLK